MTKAISKTQLQSAVNSSSSLAEVIIKLGYNDINGRHYTLIKNRASELEVDLSPVLRKREKLDIPIDKNGLEKLVGKHGNNVAAMLGELGLPAAGNTYRALHKRAAILGVTIERRGKGWLSNDRPQNRLSPKEVFVRNRRPPWREDLNILRRCLLEAGRGRNCEQCGISEWNDTPIIFDIHHINGDPLDNRENNLAILCPNCHRQVEKPGGSW